jgi:hypothetical protein
MTSVPTIDQLISGFPNPISKIEGQPEYYTLAVLCKTLSRNAASIPSTKGGGAHGYLGAVKPATIYATIAPATPFIAPVYPGTVPTNAVNATAAQIGEAVRLHQEAAHEFREWTNVHHALKKQLISTIDPVYLSPLEDTHIRFEAQTVGAMMEYLMETYGHISPQELVQNTTTLNSPWDPNTPMEYLINQIEKCRDFATDGKQTISNEQLLNAAYTKIYSSGKKADADKTWLNIKMHFLTAQKLLRRQQQTTGHQNFQANNINNDNNKENITDALSLLTEATMADRQVFFAKWQQPPTTSLNNY